MEIRCLRWALPTEGTVRSVLGSRLGDMIYCGSDDGVFTALGTDGTLRWRFAADYALSEMDGRRP